MTAESNTVCLSHLSCQPYKYQSLPEGNYMRLLRLAGASTKPEDPLSGFVFTCPSSPHQDYMALSYTWGGEKPIRALKTPDGVLHITPNLDAALRTLLRTYGPGLVIWVDAICINQENNQERSHQVQLMRQIYKAAERVVVFLGEEKNDSSLALDLMTKLSRQSQNTDLEQPANFDDLEISAIPNTRDPSWAALRKFLRRPWFRRVWIVQECVVAKDIEVYCGDWHCSFETLVRSMVEIHDLPQPMLHLNRETVDRRAWDETFRGHNCLVALMLLRRKYHLHENQDLLTLLDQFQGFEATVARDKFFALLGLCKDWDNVCLKPDYDQPFEEVLMRYTKYLLGSNDPIRLLSLARPEPTNSKFPSWIPDWTKRSRRENLSESFTPSVSEGRFEAATRSQSIANLDAAGRILTIHGALFQETYQLGVDYWTRLRDEHPLVILSLIWMDAKESSKDMKITYVDGKPHLEALWETLTMGRPSSGGTGSAANMASFAAARNMFELFPHSLEGGPSSRLKEAEVAILLITDLLNDFKFCIFLNGYIGMVPVSAEKGDVVAVLLGARVPFLLRPVPDSLPPRYRLVGECYVQGVMNGEALSMPNLRFEGLELI